jgi:DNA invertase Pin-like site-specific DNA recombinase
MNVVGYLRVSTREQAESGLGLDAQRRAITDEADRRGWSVTWCTDEGYTGRNAKRPGLQEALRLLKRKEASVLVVAKLDRLSRSVHDFTGTVQVAHKQRWALVVLDPVIDMTTPNGRMVANILASVAEWESDINGDRTRAAMAEAKAKGQRFGRERCIPPKVVKRIMRMHAQGVTYNAIAKRLDASGVPTPNGGQRWYPSTVRRLVLVERNAKVA